MVKNAKITTFKELAKIRNNLGKVVCTSGAFDPVHPGHLSCILKSKEYGDTLIVVVNGNSFAESKKGRAFQDVRTRCQIISCVKGVDYVIPFDVKGDTTVQRALYHLKPDVFTKGGPYEPKFVPEQSICDKLGIQVVTKVGYNQGWEGSDFLDDWEDYLETTKNAVESRPDHPEIVKLEKEIQEDISYFFEAAQARVRIASWRTKEELKKFEKEVSIRSKQNIERKAKLRKLKEKSKVNLDEVT